MLGRGASADQDARFGNKMKKLKSTMHFENALSTKVRTSQQLESPQRRLTSVLAGVLAGRHEESKARGDQTVDNT